MLTVKVHIAINSFTAKIRSCYIIPDNIARLNKIALLPVNIHHLNLSRPCCKVAPLNYLFKCNL